jgi:probable addiction module antidote protein
MVNVSPFDMAEYLDNDAAIAEYLSLAAADEDPKVFLKALRTVSRARGMMELAKKADMPRESLYRALSENGNPSYATLRKIVAALGCKLELKPV